MTKKKTTNEIEVEINGQEQMIKALKSIVTKDKTQQEKVEKKDVDTLLNSFPDK